MISSSNFELRPHHSLCIQFFIGKGYSEDFIRAMTEIIVILEKENPLLRLTEHCDIICENCPNNIDGICKDNKKVSSIDRRCLETYNMQFDDIIRWSELKKLAYNNIISQKQLATVCHDCTWRTLCFI